MLVIICPTCGSDLLEQERDGIYCLKCGDTFQIADAGCKHLNLFDTYSRMIEYENFKKASGKKVKVW